MNSTQEMAQLNEQMASINRSDVGSPADKGPGGGSSKSRGGMSKFGKLVQGRMEKMTNAVLNAGQQPTAQDDKKTQETLGDASDLLDAATTDAGATRRGHHI